MNKKYDSDNKELQRTDRNQGIDAIPGDQRRVARLEAGGRPLSSTLGEDKKDRNRVVSPSKKGGTRNPGKIGCKRYRTW